jgi:hypothetical protein
MAAGDGQVLAGRQGLAAGATQQGVHQAHQRRTTELAGGFGGGADRGVRRQPQRVELGQAGQQQAVHREITRGQRLGQPLRQGVVVAPAMAQRAEADRLEQGAVARIGHVGQGLAQHRLERAALAQHRRQHAGGAGAKGGAGRGIHGVRRAGRALR